jgi:hypothetical protein
MVGLALLSLLAVRFFVSSLSPKCVISQSTLSRRFHQHCVCDLTLCGAARKLATSLEYVATHVDIPHLILHSNRVYAQVLKTITINEWVSDADDESEAAAGEGTLSRTRPLGTSLCLSHNLSLLNATATAPSCCDLRIPCIHNNFRLCMGWATLLRPSCVHLCPIEANYRGHFYERYVLATSG